PALLLIDRLQLRLIGGIGVIGGGRCAATAGRAARRTATTAGGAVRLSSQAAVGAVPVAARFVAFVDLLFLFAGQAAPASAQDPVRQCHTDLSFPAASPRHKGRGRSCVTASAALPPDRRRWPPDRSQCPPPRR